MIKSDGEVYVETDLNTDGIDKGLATAEKKISKFSTSVKNLKSQIKNAFSKGFETNASQSDMTELQSQIRKTEMQLDRLIEKQIRFVETGGDRKSRTFAGMEYDIEIARTKLQELQNTLTSVSDKSPRHLGKFRSAVDRLIESLLNLNKKTKSAHGSLLKMLGSSILFSTVFRAINFVTKGFSDGINNLAQYSDETNAELSALKSSLTQLKNSFAAAFAPILSVVTPAITQFINLIAKAANIVAAFFAALSGKSTYTKAIEVQEDYRDSLEGTAESAKKAKKYLSGLDEVRTFTEAETSTGVSVKDMFREEEIEGSVINFAEKLREAFKNGDGKAIGNIIGQKLKEIKWKDVFLKVGNFFETAINEAIELWKGSFEADPVGTSIASAILAYFATHTLGISPKILISAITWVIGFDVGKSLGKVLFPEDADLYDSFSWFGEDGFFDNAFMDWETIFIGMRDESNGLIHVLDLLKQAFTGARLESEDLFFGLDDLIDEYGPLIKDWFQDGVAPWFTKEKWSGVLDGIKQVFKDAFNTAGNFAIKALNKVIEGIESLINRAVETLIGFANLVNKVPFIEKINLDSYKVSLPRIPMLATGAVIPPNAPFMAMLGDQKHGTNIEAPLDTIKQAMREVVGNGNGGRYSFTAQINRRTLFEEVINEAKLQQSATGRNPFELA